MRTESSVVSTSGGLRFGVTPWIVWGVAALYFLYDYFQQMAPSAMASQLTAAFNIGATELGTLASFYFVSYALMQIPVGLLLDRFGAKRPLLVACLVAALGNVVFALSATVGQAELSRLIIGVGAAFSYVACLKLAANWFRPGMFATIVGLTNVVGMSGGIVAGAPLAITVESFGWQGTLHGLAALGVVIAVLIVLFIKDRPDGAASTKEKQAPGQTLQKALADLKHIVRNAQFWLAGFHGACLNSGFTVIGGLWGSAILVNEYGIDKVSAADAVSYMFVGGILGSFFWGWVSDWLGRRKPPMIAASLCMIAVMTFLLYGPDVSLAMAKVMLVVLGFACGGNVLAYAIGNDNRPAGGEGTTAGFLNTCVIGGTVSHWWAGIWIGYTRLLAGKVSSASRPATIRSCLARLPSSSAYRSLPPCFYVRHTASW